LECLFSIVRDFGEVVQIKRSNATAAETEAKMGELALDIIKNVLDALIGFSRLNRGTLGLGNMGMTGTATSLIGIYQVWNNDSVAL
jgi:hypothetical protein